MAAQENSQTTRTQEQTKEAPQTVVPTVPNWTFPLLPDKLHQPQPVASHCVEKDEKPLEKQRD